MPRGRKPSGRTPEEQLEHRRARQRKNSRKYRLAHPDKCSERVKDWRERNRDQFNKNQQERRAKDPQKVRDLANHWAERNPEKVKTSRKKTAEKHGHKAPARAMRRKGRQLMSTPSWADQGAIDAIYLEAKNLTKRTMIRHVVDHIVPLVSKIVCGLHIPQNMQVMLYHENARKHNMLIESIAVAPTVANGLLSK